MKILTVELAQLDEIRSEGLRDLIVQNPGCVVMCGEIAVADNRRYHLEFAYFPKQRKSEVIGFLPDGKPSVSRPLSGVSFDEAVVDFIAHMGIDLTCEIRSIGEDIERQWRFLN